MNRRYTINPRLLSSDNDNVDDDEGGSVYMENINNLIKDRLLMLKLNDIRQKKLKLLQKENDLRKNLEKFEELKLNYLKIFDEYHCLQKELKKFHLLNETVKQMKQIKLFANKLQYYCSEEKIPIENDDNIINTLNDTIKTYESLDKLLLKNYQKFQNEIFEIFNNNDNELILNNHLESFQLIKRLLNECKEQWNRLENLNEQFKQIELINQWIDKQQQKEK